MLTRWNPATAAVALLFTGVLAVGPVLALLDADGRGEMVFLGLLCAVFGFPFLWTLWRVPKALRGMGIEIDADGIHQFDGRRVETIRWADVEKVGFGAYSRSYRGLPTRSMSGFEIYRKGDVDPMRWTVSPYGEAAVRIEQAVRRFRPDLWTGPFTHQR